MTSTQMRPILVIGCGDPTSSIHAPNESQDDLGDVEKATLSEAIAFRLLATDGSNPKLSLLQQSQADARLRRPRWPPSWTG